MIQTKKHGDLEYLTADGITAAHGFTTRFGGVSGGHLSSLNLGQGRGDARENVLENYRRLGEALGFDPHRAVLSRQIHSDIVLPVTMEHAGAGLYTPPLPDCDGLVTNTAGLALIIFTADCTPILFHDPVTGAVGACHAGWKGTAKNIAARVVEAMVRHYGSRPEDIHAAIGPNLAQCCFETDWDVPQALIKTYGEEVKSCIVTRGEKFHPDIKAVNELALRRAGVTHVEISEDCTYCQHDRFWSHRFTKGERGSQGAVILCQEANS